MYSAACETGLTADPYCDSILEEQIEHKSLDFHREEQWWMMLESFLCEKKNPSQHPAKKRTLNEEELSISNSYLKRSVHIVHHKKQAIHEP